MKDFWGVLLTICGIIMIIILVILYVLSGGVASGYVDAKEQCKKYCFDTGRFFWSMDAKNYSICRCGGDFPSHEAEFRR